MHSDFRTIEGPVERNTSNVRREIKHIKNILT
jgi:hypothetical protein